MAPGKKPGVYCRLHALDEWRQIVTPGRVSHTQFAITPMAMMTDEVIESLGKFRCGTQPAGSLLDACTLKFELRIRVLCNAIEQCIQLFQHDGAFHIAGAG